MMKANYVLMIVMTLLLSFATNATSMNLEEIESIFNEFNLQRDEYAEKGDLQVEKFKTNFPLSPFESEFDRRIVVVVLGKPTVANRPKAEPLLPEQIFSQIHSRTSEKHHGWTLSTDEIIYAAQGQVPGFTVDCTVAGKMFESDYVTVSECYSLDQKEEFLKILSTLH